jgi:ATP-dependent helicase/nuclease subunit A
LEAPVVFLAAPQEQNRSYPIQLYVDRQGGTIEGYMAVYGKKQEKSWKHPELIACPSRWGKKTEIEKRFEEAEKNRLLYVAATRAGAHLIISRIDGKTAFFWHKLASKLTAGTLPDQATPVTPRQSTPLALSTQDVTSATAAITASWQARQQPTYAITSVRASVLDETELIPGGIAGGAAFGRVIHRLLQNLLQQPSIDLAAESSRIMAEECLDANRHDEVLAAVNTARQTDIWRRACAAPRRLLESPLAVRQIGVNGIPIIIGGVVDLAFEETGEWVLVDYKSDDTPGRSLDQLTAHYTPQLVAYAEAWSSLIPVKEIGLLFVRTGTYRDISAALPVSTSAP